MFLRTSPTKVIEPVTRMAPLSATSRLAKVIAVNALSAVLTLSAPKTFRASRASSSTSMALGDDDWVMMKVFAVSSSASSSAVASLSAKIETTATVSGAPKIRAMQIIAQNEPVQRGFYAGALGYFGYDGNMDTCIMLRTALVKDGRVHIQSGAGVVADSIPAAEYQETISKASALFKAVALAERF